MTSVTAAGWQLRHDGRVLTVTACPAGRRTRVTVLDGDTVQGQRVVLGRAVVPLDDADPARGKVAVRSFRAGVLHGVALVLPGTPRPEVVPFEPPPGGRAHRVWRWQRDHPRTWAARHVVVATAQVLAGLLAVSLVVDLLPSFDLPAWDLPDLPALPLPHVPLPQVRLPHWSLPGWARAVLETKKYWFPVLLGVVVAVSEVRRRRRRRDEPLDTETATGTEPR